MSQTRDLRSPASGSSLHPFAFILLKKKHPGPSENQGAIARDDADPSATSHAVPTIVTQVTVAVADRDCATIVASRGIGLKIGELLTADCGTVQLEFGLDVVMLPLAVPVPIAVRVHGRLRSGCRHGG